MNVTHSKEISSGNRFRFGDNWFKFLILLNEERIVAAELSLKEKLGLANLDGKTFLDVGSGSGLFSLAARRLGAKVHSFDYDPKSVLCTQELKRRYFPDDPQWIIEEGSALDINYLTKLGKFDVVYSWGVLHHTGAMWAALGNVAPLVTVDGHLFVAIYNDQGWASVMWKKVKKFYCAAPLPLRTGILLLAFLRVWGAKMTLDLLKGRPFASWRCYGQGGGRGMSPWHDVIDWVGGYPFEVAKPEKIFNFYRDRGFRLHQLETCGGRLGCNQYLFTRN
jgi:2-polyprenyl-3-methyl-5-hydroxy-6-metoxy-1,4-benzoquinol methylase